MLCAITSKRSLKDSEVASAGTLNNYGAAKLATAKSNAVDDRWRIKSGALHLPPSPSPGSWSSESSPFRTVFGLRFDCACTLPSPVFNFRRYTRATKINQRENLKNDNF